MRGRFRPNYLVHLQECHLLTHLYWQVNLDILTYPSIWHFEPFLSVYVPVASHYNCNFLTCLGPCLWQIRSYNGGRVIYGIMRTCKSCLSTQCNLSTQASIQTWYMYNDWKKKLLILMSNDSGNAFWTFVIDFYYSIELRKYVDSMLG